MQSKCRASAEVKKCRGSGAEVQVQSRCRCRGSGAQVQMHRCRCRGAGAQGQVQVQVQVQVHRCTGAQVHRCTGAQVHRWCTGGAQVVYRCSEKVHRWCTGAQVQSAKVVKRGRGGLKVKRCREVQSCAEVCRGAQVQVQRYRGAEVVQRCSSCTGTGALVLVHTRCWCNRSSEVL